jgi:hypothetical protein
LVAVGRVDHRVHDRMPALVVCLHLLPRQLHGPGLLQHLVGLDDADEVHQIPAAQIIKHCVPAGPEKQRHRRLDQTGRQALRRDRDSPGGIARVIRRRLADDLLAHHRLQPIRADQQIAARGGAVSEMQRDAVCVLVESGDAFVQPHHVGF